VTYPIYLAIVRAQSFEERLNRFDILLTGLYVYDENLGRLPAALKHDEAGNVLYSWRVSLLPFTEGVKDLLDTESSWTAASNQYFRERAIYQFCDLRDRNRADRSRGIISLILGPDTPMQEKSSMRLSKVPHDTILLIEAQPNAEHWMAPGDISPDADELKRRHRGSGMVIGFADGEIWHLRDAVPFEELMKFASAVPTEPRDREAALGPFKVTSRRAHVSREP